MSDRREKIRERLEAADSDHSPTGARLDLMRHAPQDIAYLLEIAEAARDADELFQSTGMGRGGPNEHPVAVRLREALEAENE